MFLITSFQGGKSLTGKLHRDAESQPPNSHRSSPRHLDNGVQLTLAGERVWLKELTLA
ncbi:hypothetical protein P885DRAFT_82102 [Corynascus similis CBS 632.67]